MAFGGFAPMPLRLGGPVQEGWSAEQHARAAETTAQLWNTMPYAVFMFTHDDAIENPGVLNAYLGRNGTGLSFGPTVAVNGTGDSTITFPTVWEDAYGETFPISITRATASAMQSGSTNALSYVYSTSANTVRVQTRLVGAGTMANRTVVVKVWIDAGRKRRREFYGGAPDKRASRTEGRIPYAWSWYQHFVAAMGSAYSGFEERDTLQHCENLAHARAETAITRAAEKLSRSATPTFSEETLAEWARLQRVPFTYSDLTEDLRAKCAAKFRLASGNDYLSVSEACAKLLGAAFVRIWVQEGTDLATPPSPTYWPAGAAGPSTYDLGGGVWTSARSHVVVETTRPASMGEGDYLKLVNSDLFQMLNDMLPSWCTFDWAEGLTDGFLLDLSQLDYTGLT